MASNVNTKFVVILASSLMLLAALVAGAAYVTLKKSPSDHVAAGDKFMAEGDYKEASKSYSKAVNKEQTNVAYLKKWQDALIHRIPETDLEYSQEYNENYVGILRRLAALQTSDPAAQRDMFEAIYQQTRLGGGSPEAWTNYIDMCNTSLEKLDESDPATEQLRRYRGFARVAMMPMVVITDDERTLAIEDLEAAFTADPTDIESLIQLASLYRQEWIQALNTNRQVTVTAAMQKYQGAIDRIVAEFPDDPRALAVKLDFDIESRLRLDTTVAGQQKIRRQLRGVEEPLVESFLTCDTSRLDSDLLLRTLSYGRALWTVRPDDYVEIGLQILDRVTKDRPDDFDALFFRGTQLILAGRYDEAKETLQRVIDTPDLPISLDGIRLKNMRIQARFQQANNALTKYEATPAGAEHDAALAEAHALGDRLSVDLGADNSMSLMINSQVAMFERRNQDAVTLLQRLNTLTNGENVGVLRLLSQALTAQGTLGAAMDMYDKWIQLDEANPVPLLESAQLKLRLRDTEGAIARLQAALVLVPDNEEIKKQINTLQITSGTGDTSIEASDPIVAQLMRAEAMSKNGEGGIAEALALVEQVTAEHPDDTRPISMLVELRARTGDTAGALAAAKRGQELLPGNETFNRYVAMLSSGDRLQIAEQYIDSGAEAEPVKLIKKYALYKQAGNEARANELLAQAESQYPKNPSVLDTLFVNAMRDDDMPRAREIAATAAEVNADQADGLLYQARLNIKENTLNAALNNLQIAVEKAPYSPQAWRLYGQVLLQSGRIEDAVEALAKAHDYKPDDAEIAKTYATTLIQLQRYETALEVARSARRFTTSDNQLNDIWLALEAQTGEPEAAVEFRRYKHKTSPGDAENTRQLIALLTTLGKFDEANELIQQSLGSGQNDLGLTITQANWYAQQGQVDEGVRRLQAYIDSVPAGELNEDPFLSLGTFLINNGRADEGVAAYREGAKHQSPEMMIADRRIGDYFFSVGDYEKALQAYQQVTSAGADTNGIVAKRVIESLQRLNRWDEAEAELDTLAAGADEDLQTLLLRADIAYGRGDERTARELVNRAVEVAPNKPEPFIRRAQLDFDNPERLSFVLSDLDQAIRLAPNAIQQRRMRADALLRNKRSAEAIAELRRGIEAIPDSSELRRMLIQELWQSGRHDEAHAEARNAIDANPKNPDWLMVAGDIAARDEQMKDHWERSVYYYTQAYEIRKNLDLALRLANSYLYTTPPDPDEAIAVLKALGSGFDDDSQILILRARATQLKGDHKDAVALAERSIAAAKSVAELRHWFLHMEAVFPDQKEMIAFVDRMKSSDRLMPAYLVHAAAFQAYNLDRHKEIIKGLRDSEEAVKQFAIEDGNVVTLVALYRVLGQLEYGQQMWEQAADSYAKGARLVPDDMEFNNNLAYTLARHLGKLEEAVAPAERAVFLSPANSPALDTLGWIYYRLGRLGQAKQHITRAIQNAQLPVEKGGANLHMAMVLLAEGDRPEARKYAELANDIIKSDAFAARELQQDFNQLMSDLQHAENVN
ncbi:MAG: tetratricopeptide repeat protein [Phycisphaeraceae bacterium]|nr:tetratricopeptide repeat protein [Phycisphaeraceae bacterium]MCB9848717.1 tetratricopeptide repeat protein [Phycisphaeraceae bacterium]